MTTAADIWARMAEIARECTEERPGTSLLPVFSGYRFARLLEEEAAKERVGAADHGGRG